MGLLHNRTAHDHQNEQYAHRNIQILGSNLEAEGQSKSHQTNDECGQRRTNHIAFAAGGESSAQHTGGDDVHGQGTAQIALGGAKIGGQHNARNSSTDGTEDIGGHNDQTGVDARELSGLRIDTNQKYTAAIFALMEQEIGNDDHDHKDNKLGGDHIEKLKAIPHRKECQIPPSVI